MFFIESDTLFDQRAVAAQKTAPDVTHAPARQQDQPFFQFDQPVTVDNRSRRAVTTLISSGDQQGEILITGVIRGEHRQMREFITHQLALNMEISANNGFNPGAMTRSVELHQTTEVSKIGDRQRRHAQRGRLFTSGPVFASPSIME